MAPAASPPWRMRDERFHRPAGAYFLSHSIGLLPLRARQTLEEGFLAPWRAGDKAAWPRWLTAIEAWRAALGPLIGARAVDICPQTNISSALAKIVSCIAPKGRKRVIVLCEDDFPTIGDVLGQARKRGFEVAFVAGGARLADPDAWSRGYGDDVALLHVTHVFSNFGLRAPVGAIVARARAAGAVAVVDIAQSAGAVAVDVGAWGAHFATGTSVKYLCGGPGAAFLWANPETIGDFEPTDVGWFSRDLPFAGDVHDFAYARGAARFWGGTPSVAPYALARAGAEALAATGVRAIDARNQHLLGMLIDGFDPAQIASHTAPGERGAAVIIRPADSDGAAQALDGAGVQFDRRAGGIRLSVHLYTDEDDITQARTALAPFL